MFRAYDRTMRHKLGLLEVEDDGDEALVRDLLQVHLHYRDSFRVRIVIACHAPLLSPVSKASGKCSVAE